LALVLVKHDISGEVVEIPEEQLAHPILGPHYKRVRRNAAGKIYAWNEADPDAQQDSTDNKAEASADKKAVVKADKKADN
jgi:hypothetical protein